VNLATKPESESSAAESAVGIKQQASLELAGVFGRRRVLLELLQVIARRCGKAELVADEVVEHSAGIAADRTVRFVGDDEVEVRG